MPVFALARGAEGEVVTAVSSDVGVGLLLRLARLVAQHGHITIYAQFPPIPSRDWDWCAEVGDADLGRPAWTRAFGATPEAAAWALVEQEEWEGADVL